jgi:hypothetical protein
MLYRVHLDMSGIHPAHTGSCKSNYHAITTTTDPIINEGNNILTMLVYISIHGLLVFEAISKHISVLSWQVVLLKVVSTTHMLSKR